MQKIFRKRVLRDLRRNVSRYFALFGLIALGMYLIVGMVGAAENIISSVEEGQERNYVEDGSFTVFVPLEDTVIDDLSGEGVTVETMFYLDYQQSDNSTVRIYENRQKINLLEIEKGELAQNAGEVVLEKLYADSNSLNVGDTIEIGGIALTITGLASTPDYDGMYRETTDSASDSEAFGTAFVCVKQYRQLQDANNAMASEVYAYSYLLNGSMTDDELKDYLKDLEFDESDVTDVYFRELIDDIYEQKYDLEDGINELKDGAEELRDGLTELSDYNEDLKDGINQIFDSYLQNATEELEGFGIDTSLTADNYQSVIENLMNKSGLMKEQLEPVLDGLNSMKDYKDAVVSYTDSVAQLSSGASQLGSGSSALANGLNELTGNNQTLNDGASALLSSYISQANSSLSAYGITEILTEENYSQVLSQLISQAEALGNGALKGQLESALSGLSSVKAYKDGISAYTGGVESARDGANTLASGTSQLQSGASELSGYNDALKSGSSQIFSTYLAQISNQLSELGIDETLTSDNYQTVLTKLMGQQGDKIIKEQLQSALDGLKSLKEYQDAITTYTDAVSAAAEGSEQLLDGITELQEAVDEIIDELFSLDIDNLTSYMTNDENPRIGSSIDDVLINKYAGILAGIIVMVLFTFVISVFVVHGIESEQQIIGALYALGVSKRQLLRHYLMLPVFITLAGSIIGTALGFSELGTGYFAQESIDYFSMPQIVSAFPIYLILYGLIMPSATAVIVNYLVINKKLKKPVLQLLKKEENAKSGMQIKIKNLGYIRTFQIRQFFKELRSGIAVVLGMFICLLILMLGIDCYVLCKNIEIHNKEDATFEYMYTYKYPTAEVPEGGEPCFYQGLKKEAYGYNLEVSLLGITGDNPYFDFKVSSGKNIVTISNAVASKFNTKVGDKIVLTDEVSGQDYAFTVEKIVDYSIGLYVFMDIDSMRELFGQEEDYYNLLYSGQDLGIESGRLYAITTKSDIEQSSNIFINTMMPMVIMMVVLSVSIFIIVMYLMMKVMIDRSAHNISLMKVFGYRKKEIKELYLDGNLLLVGFAALICIPLTKVFMDAVYPYLIANISSGADLTFKWYMYAMVYAGIIVCYLLINRMLVRRINRFLPADIIKDRE